MRTRLAVRYNAQNIYILARLSNLASLPVCYTVSTFQRYILQPALHPAPTLYGENIELDLVEVTNATAQYLSFWP